MAKINFNSANLHVDWISLNIKRLSDPNIQKISFYLSDLGFNSSIKEGPKTKSIPIISKKTNCFEVTFVRYKPDPLLNAYWDGTIISFTSKNADYFFECVRKNTVDWEIFDRSNMSLGRFDIQYFRKNQITDPPNSVDLFLKDCYQKYKAKSKRRIAELGSRNEDEKNNSGSILRLGSRESGNFYRIYQKKNGLEFELELKKKAVKLFQSFFFTNQLLKFEEKILKYFYQYSSLILSFDHCYTDWLAIGLRKITVKPVSFNLLVTTYLDCRNLDTFGKTETFFKLIQFLSFIRTCKKEKNFKIEIKKQSYYLISFRLIDFLNYIGVTGKNQYQLNKAKEFFRTIQSLSPLVVQNFELTSYRSSLMFPYVSIEPKNKFLIADIAIAKELYNFSDCYPFLFPESFKTYTDKHDLETKLTLIQALSTVSFMKFLPVDTFLNKFAISNQRKTNLKKGVIHCFLELVENDIIEPEVILIQKLSLECIPKNVLELKPSLLTKTSEIHFFEKHRKIG